jgi:exodeoxyribonuclease-3
MSTVTLQSWNVNGLRACAGKGFGAWLDGCGADIVCLQEVRAMAHQLPEAVRAPHGWHTAFSAAEKPGYSGVALYSRRPPDELHTTLGEPRFDCEGRLQRARFGRLWVVGGYFPNGNGTPLPGGQRSNDRIPYKLDFYRALFDQLEPLRAAGEAIVVLGDWNTAPAEVDLARPKENRETSGFRSEERAEVARWLAAGWTDTFRHVHPDTTGIYSWWSQRFGVRQKNIGWRIDLALCSGGALPYLRGAQIDTHVQGSDHCPIGVTFDAAVVG